MSHEIYADHAQQYLLPPSLEDWLPPDHPARFLRDFVGGLDLGQLGFRQRFSEDGRPIYSSELLLTAWLYGYLEKVRSSRKLEHAGRTHLPLIWLLGTHCPDHNTLWRFWRAHRKAIQGVFRHSVLIAKELGLVGMVVHALDGTKIPVAASSQGGLHRTTLEQLKEAIDASIAKTEAAIEAQGTVADAPEALPEKLQQKQERRAAIEAAMAHLDALDQERALPAEPEARMMKQAKGGTQWAYNAQAVVDGARGIVVAHDVVNEAADYEQLKPMLKQAKEVAHGTAEYSVADAGYCNTRHEIDATAQGHTVILPRHGREGDATNPYHKSRFIYDPDAYQYICPQGHPLPHSSTRRARNNRPEQRVYRCRACSACPVRAQCSPARPGGAINRDANEAFRERQRRLRETPEAQAQLRRRKAIVEPLFGHLKENLGFRRWSACGLKNAQAQWAMLCLTVNLKKLYQAWRRAKPSAPQPRTLLRPLQRPCTA